MRSWMDIKAEVLLDKIDLLDEQIMECIDGFVKMGLVDIRNKHKRELSRYIERKERFRRYEDNTR